MVIVVLLRTSKWVVFSATFKAFDASATRKGSIATLKQK